MKLLSVDPSSTCTGFAIFESSGRLLSFGHHAPPRHLSAGERIDAMIEQLLHVEDIGAGAELVVMEVASGKIAARTAASCGAGLAIYGELVGSLRYAMIARYGVEVVRITERQWTGNRPKEMRAREIDWTFPQYRLDRDHGYNIADAIGLGLWYMTERRLSTEGA